MSDEQNPGPKDSSTPSPSSEAPQPPLGIAGRMARQFIDSPVTPLLIIAALVIGVLGLLFTPRQEDPKISVPMIDLMVRYPGVPPKQVESLVTSPLERLMSEVPDIKHVYSATRRGEAVVTVRFEVGESMRDSIVKIHDKLQSNKDRIPPGVGMPLVKAVSIDDVPIVNVTLWSTEVDDSHLRTLGQHVLQRLSEVPNTGDGFVVGGRREQFRVKVRPERLSGFGMTLDQIASTIRRANGERKTGYTEEAGTRYEVYAGNFLNTVEEVEGLVIGVRGQQPIYVRDVAEVSHGPEEAKQIVTYSSGPGRQEGRPEADGAAAVTVAIAKKIDTNGVTVARDILAQLDQLKGSLIPGNVNVDITRNYGKTANNKVNDLLGALFEAAIIVSILCLIGLGVRAATVVITVIPIVVLVTVWSAWVLNYTIDRVSLFALVFAIGILVDDATVVVENIFRRWLVAGETKISVAIDAVREVGNPTVLATLTIISALLPMGFVSGLMGPYMRPIPVLGSSAMFFSLLAAFIFTPWVAYQLRPRLRSLERAERREERIRRGIRSFYRPMMERMCTTPRYRRTFLITLIVLTVAAAALFPLKVVPVKMLPFDNKSTFQVVINMPEGTALPTTANVASRLSKELRKIPEVRSTQAYSGTAAPFNFNGMVRHYYLREEAWQGQIQVKLEDKHKRERQSHAIAVAARELLTPVAEELGARIQVVEMPPGPPVLQTVVAEIYGPDGETRRQVARDMTDMFEQVDNIVDVDNYLAAPYEYWKFQVDTQKAVREGVTVSTINRNLEMILDDHRMGDAKRGVVLEPTYIILQVPLSQRSEVKRLTELPIPSAGGAAVGTGYGRQMAEMPVPQPKAQTIPLGEVGRFVREEHDPIIYHKDLRPMEYVTGEMEGRLGAPIYGMLAVEDLLDGYRTPNGYQMSGMPGGLIGPPKTSQQADFEWSGEWTVTYETFRDMGIAFAGALILIYGLIVYQFKNYTVALLIMGPIPLTLIGIVGGHWLMAAEFTATSMIGMIALAGIIVRNSILLVEFVRNEVSSGRKMIDAVISAGEIRMRPILITALTLMAGAFAIIQDPIFQGMAVSLFFGTLVATVLTLVAIPLGCLSAQRHVRRIADVPEEGPGGPEGGGTPPAGGTGGGPSTQPGTPGTGGETPAGRDAGTGRGAEGEQAGPPARAGEPGHKAAEPGASEGAPEPARPARGTAKKKAGPVKKRSTTKKTSTAKTKSSTSSKKASTARRRKTPPEEGPSGQGTEGQ